VSYRLARRPGPVHAALIALIALVAGACPAPAQFVAAGGAVVPPFSVGAPAFYPPGYWGGWGWYNRNPYEGYLNGAANVTLANAQYLQSVEQAKLLRQDAIRSSIRTRREGIQERLYEMSLRPDAEQVRQQLMMQALQRSMNNPPLNEIWNGEALNHILTAVKTAQTRGTSSGPVVPLPPDLVRHINVTGGTTYAGVGVFKGDGKLTWPFVLRQPAFKEDRAKINELVAQAVSQAPSGEVSVEVLNEINAAVQRMQDQVDGSVGEITPTNLVLADRYLRELRQGLKVLQSNDVARYFGPKGSAQGSTVGELLNHMINNGLRFAPAVSGGESYYTVLHNDLVTYEMGLGRVAVAAPGQPPLPNAP
jgi:hypothetical protein